MARDSVEDRDLSEAQLFVDDTWVEDSLGVNRVFHSPKKYPWPVLQAEGKWEHYCPATHGTVLPLVACDSGRLQGERPPSRMTSGAACRYGAPTDRQGGPPENSGLTTH